MVVVITNILATRPQCAGVHPQGKKWVSLPQGELAGCAVQVLSGRRRTEVGVHISSVVLPAIAGCIHEFVQAGLFQQWPVV